MNMVFHYRNNRVQFGKHACKVLEQAVMSQTLNVLFVIFLRDPTSHIPMSPTIVPTRCYQNTKCQ